MRLLLILETHFYIDDNLVVWSDRVVDYEFLKRYLVSFKEIVLCGRCKKISNGNGKLKVSGEKVKFVGLPDIYGPVQMIKNRRKIRKIIKKEIQQVDCVLYRFPTHLAFLSYDLVLKGKKRLALEVMISADKMFEGTGVKSKIMNTIVDTWAKRVCLKANAVSYVTERILQSKYPCMAIKYGESKNYITSFYSTIDLDDKYFNKKIFDPRNVPKPLKIIHVGYMDTYRKGQKVLINVGKQLIDNGYKVHIEFIGDGKKKEEFMNLVKDLGINKYVTFTGLINDKDLMMKHLIESDLLVFPTESEGLPRTIIEAMAVGLPCISSPVDGIPELLDDEFLVDYNDVNGYTEKIIYLINNWNEVETISLRNYKKSLKYRKSILTLTRGNFYKELSKICKQ